MHATLMLRHAVTTNACGAATIFGERQRSWAEVGARVPRMAGALTSLGLKNGDVVAVLSMNNDRFIELFFAAPWAGGVIAPLNVRWSVEENAQAIADCGAAVLVVDDEFVGQARELRSRGVAPETIIYIGEGDAPDGMLDYETLVVSHEPAEDAGRKGDDVFAIFFTGGTTGRPKGVMLSHEGFGQAIMVWIAMQREIEGIRFAYVGGLFHLVGAVPAMFVTLTGGTHIILPKFEPVAFMQAITRHKATVIIMVPTMVQTMLTHPEFPGNDLSSLKLCFYGGSPMPEAVVRKAAELLPNLEFIQSYAMTETGSLTSMLRWSDHDFHGPNAHRVKSVGQPVFGVEVRIVDPAGNTLPRGETGEILMRSRYLMTGYVNMPDQTAEALRGGWMHSGDAGRIDEDGYLYVSDRIKDMIVTGGENVFSIEVERAIYLHPAVKEAAVIGLPSEKWGETVHAIVVLRDGMSATQDEIIAHCRALIGAYKCPKSVEFRSEPLPLSPAGKVQKNVLRQPYLTRAKA